MVNGAVLGFLVLGVGTKDGWTNSTQTRLIPLKLRVVAGDEGESSF